MTFLSAIANVLVVAESVLTFTNECRNYTCVGDQQKECCSSIVLNSVLSHRQTFYDMEITSILGTGSEKIYINF